MGSSVFHVSSSHVKPFIEAALDRLCTKDEAEHAFLNSMRNKNALNSEEELKSLFAAEYESQMQLQLAQKSSKSSSFMSAEDVAAEEEAKIKEEEAKIEQDRFPFFKNAEGLTAKEKAKIKQDRFHFVLPGYAKPFVEDLFAGQYAAGREAAMQAFIQHMGDLDFPDSEEDLAAAFSVASYYKGLELYP